jgi:DNA helicase-2/ATP-dependent DNA helicase PcrA
VRRDGGVITDALATAGVPYVITGMDNLFAKPEAEAARQLFYYLAGRIDGKALTRARQTAHLGIAKQALAATVANASKARDGMAEVGAGQFRVYNLQRQFMAFLETAALREEQVPDGRGEVVFYNLGEFSQAISDFESIHFHSKPVDKYGSFGSSSNTRPSTPIPKAGRTAAT